MITRTVTGDRKVRKIKEPHLVRLFCKIGAGAVQSYSHAENTGLVISDAAKIGRIYLTSKLFVNFFTLQPIFFQNLLESSCHSPPLDPGLVLKDSARAKCKMYVLLKDCCNLADFF